MAQDLLQVFFLLINEVIVLRRAFIPRKDKITFHLCSLVDRSYVMDKRFLDMTAGMLNYTFKKTLI